MHAHVKQPCKHLQACGTRVHRQLSSVFMWASCNLCCRYKWDTLPAGQRPERGLLGLRAGLNAFANLRPAIVPPQVRSSSTSKAQPNAASAAAEAGSDFVPQGLPCKQLLTNYMMFAQTQAGLVGLPTSQHSAVVTNS